MYLGKKEIVMFIKSSLFSIAINFFIYNINVIVEYTTGLSFETFSQPNIARFFCYFLFTLFFCKKYFKRIPLFIIIFFPVLAIDSTALLYGKELLPLRFPFATIYPFLGIICGLTFRVSLRIFSIMAGISILFMVFSKLIFEPEILKYMHKRNNIITMKNEKVYDISLKTVSGNNINLLDTLKAKAALIEFYYVGCKPCEKKLTFLKQLHDEFRGKDFQMILICDGIANSFTDFVKHSEQYNQLGLAFFYDYNKAIHKYKIEGYPTEILLNNFQLIKKEKGFSLEIAQDWLRNERTLIKNIIDENY